MQEDLDLVYICYEGTNGTRMYRIMKSRYITTPKELLTHNEFILYRRKNFFKGRSTTIEIENAKH